MKNYPLFKVHIDVQSSLGYLKEVLESGYINEGIQVKQFETELSKIFGTELVLTNSCTSAITIALSLCGIKSGDDVVTTPMTCVATNTPIVTTGANIVWSDIEPETGMPGPDQIRNAITENTKAVVYVAWAGNLGRIEDVYDVCKQKNVPLILDAAHSFGAKYKGKDPSLSVADYVCYSLQAIKHVTTGDGGILTSRHSLAKAKSLKWFGLDRDASKDDKGDWKGQQWDVDIVEAGYKFNMNNLSAAVGLSQVPHIENILQKHKKNSSMYDSLFAGTVVLPLSRSVEEDTARWVYTIRTPMKNENKLRLIEKLNSEGIKAGLVHVPNDDYTCFAKFKRDLPGVRDFSSTQFSIPCGWWLSEEDINFIAKKVLDSLKGL